MKSLVIIVSTILMINLPSHMLRTPGALLSDSIVRCNGKTYGKHGDGHYHEAISKNKRWHAVHDPLSKVSPCESKTESNTGSQKPQKENTSQNTNEKKEAENKKLEQEKAKKNERLQNANIKTVLYNNESLIDFYSNFNLKLVSVILENHNASYHIVTEMIYPFQDNVLEIGVVSENKEESKRYEYDFYNLGSQTELIKQDIKLLLNDGQKVSLTDIQNVIIEDSLSHISINNKIFELTNSKVSEEVLYFSISGVEYSILLNPEVDDSALIIAGSLLFGSVFLLVVAYFLSDRRNSYRKPKLINKSSHYSSTGSVNENIIRNINEKIPQDDELLEVFRNMEKPVVKDKSPILEKPGDDMTEWTWINVPKVNDEIKKDRKKTNLKVKIKREINRFENLDLKEKIQKSKSKQKTKKKSAIIKKILKKGK